MQGIRSIDPDSPALCAAATESPFSADRLNRECFCVGVDRDALHAEVETVLRADGLSASLADTHPHLFSSLPVFVSPRHLEQAAQVVAALERAVALPAYRAQALAGAPASAALDPGSPGGVLGLDFHLDADGPRLIEINTNPGGILLNALMARAQSCCVPGIETLRAGADGVADAVLAVLLEEWRLQRGDRPLGRVAIVDEAPATQYLYPEFLQFRALLRRHGYAAEVCDPSELERRPGGLWLGGRPVDFIYNRLTDFALDVPAYDAIRDAYLRGEVAVSPHPRAHALYADKRNLALLGNRTFLADAGLDAAAVDTLVAAVPETRLLTADNRDALWADRRGWFFKPAAGYGSKASYRGDKLTRRVWDDMQHATYVAQRIVRPSERHQPPGVDPLKVDIRCYAYRGRVLLHAARLYQGQTTNFRTPGGGFAPVLTLG